jgi:hypothetical protein
MEQTAWEQAVSEANGQRAAAQIEERVYQCIPAAVSFPAAPIGLSAEAWNACAIARACRATSLRWHSGVDFFCLLITSH